MEVAERKETDATERLELFQAAVDELRKVVRGYRESRTMATKFLMNGGGGENAPLPLSRDTAFAAHLRIAELYLIMGKTEGALNELDELMSDETRLQLEALNCCLSDLTVQDDPQEKIEYVQQFCRGVSLFLVLSP